jgi:hemoglobin
MTSPPNPRSDSPSSTAYDELGDGSVIGVAVDQFYERVLADPELAGAFTGVDLDRLKDHQVALLTKVLGGPDHYSGRDLTEAHRGLGVTGTQYAKVCGLLTDVLNGLGASERVIDSVSSTLGAVRGAIVEQPDA